MFGVSRVICINEDGGEKSVSPHNSAPHFADSAKRVLEVHEP